MHRSRKTLFLEETYVFERLSYVHQERTYKCAFHNPELSSLTLLPCAIILQNRWLMPFCVTQSPRELPNFFMSFSLELFPSIPSFQVFSVTLPSLLLEVSFLYAFIVIYTEKLFSPSQPDLNFFLLILNRSVSKVTADNVVRV